MIVRVGAISSVLIEETKVRKYAPKGPNVVRRFELVTFAKTSPMKQYFNRFCNYFLNLRIAYTSYI